MARIFQRLSFSRIGLPVVAAIGLISSAIFITLGLPDRSLAEPERAPARATGELAKSARVAGAGVVEPSSEIIQIGTALSGLVMDLMVKPGDLVNKGDPLFTVDTRAIRAQLQQAIASEAEARAAIAEAQIASVTANRQLALYRNVDDPAAVSKSEVIRFEGEANSAGARLQLARAQLQAAQAMVNSAQIDLSRAMVRAPISGEILTVNIKPGEYLSTMNSGGATFIEMGQTKPLNVRIDIDEEQAHRLKLGADAYVSPRGFADLTVNAKFVRAEPLVVPKRSLTNSAQERVDVRVLQLIFELPDNGAGFKVGQQVDAYMPAKTSEKVKQ
ncbi:MAG: efflux RND transporter periplasmic adaptor subunit [Pseudomonadota bacterium]